MSSSRTGHSIKIKRRSITMILLLLMVTIILTYSMMVDRSTTTTNNSKGMKLVEFHTGLLPTLPAEWSDVKYFMQRLDWGQSKAERLKLLAMEKLRQDGFNRSLVRFIFSSLLSLSTALCQCVISVSRSTC